LEAASSKSNYGKAKMMADWSKSREHINRISNFSRCPSAESVKGGAQLKKTSPSSSWENIKADSSALPQSIISLQNTQK
jgi:hypothetical protein